MKARGSRTKFQTPSLNYVPYRNIFLYIKLGLYLYGMIFFFLPQPSVIFWVSLGTIRDYRVHSKSLYMAILDYSHEILEYR